MSCLPYEEEVAGSNLASPTQKKRRFAGKTPHGKGVRDGSPDALTASVLQPGGTGVFEGPAGVVLPVAP